MPNERHEITAWVYIITNAHHTTLYVGMTSNLNKRIYQHTTKHYPDSFSARYNVSKLVYFEGHETIVKARQRELFMKGKSRKWKEELINSINPEWNDLSDKTDFFSNTPGLVHSAGKPATRAFLRSSLSCLVGDSSL
jgi:putative endonuclease